MKRVSQHPISEQERLQQQIREVLLREVKPIVHGICAWEIAGRIVAVVKAQEAKQS